MSLTPDDIRRIASVLTTVADCEERAHKPLLATLHAVVEVPAPEQPGSYPPWSDYPDRLLLEVLQVGRQHHLRFIRIECGSNGWTVVWRRIYGPSTEGDEIASTPQSRPELVLRAELARLNALRPGELA